MSSCYLNSHLSYLDSVWVCLPSENIKLQLWFSNPQMLEGVYFRNGGELRMGPSQLNSWSSPTILSRGPMPVIHWKCLAWCLCHHCFRAHLLIPTSLMFQFRPFWNFWNCQVGNSFSRTTRWAPYMGPCKTHRIVEPSMQNSWALNPIEAPVKS